MNIAVVTGASSGMGREFVLQLGQYVTVDQIWVIARRAEALAGLAKEVTTPVRVLAMDLCRAESFDAYEKLLAEEKPNIRLLVNAAGFGKFGDYDAISLEDELRMIDLNCKALTAMTRLSLPYMTSGSHVLQLDSLSSFQPVPYITTYGATKAYVLSYSRAMQAELQSKGIRMLALCPGWVKTEFFNHAFQTNDNRVQYFNRLYEAKDVVATGLKALYKTRKQVCVPGLPVQLQVLGVKLLPHSLVMKIWMNQQKKPKNNQGLTD